MWYVMQVRTGTEENIRCQCQRLISSNVLERCFIPYYQQKKRFQGEWHIQERILFPGYVFLIAQNLECLSENLRKVIGMTRLLGTGIIESDQVRILTGPLQGMEGCIRKIDRHKRKARVSVEMFGRSVDMEVGLEIISKVTQEEFMNGKEKQNNENTDA